jgi:hypothetical protein
MAQQETTSNTGESDTVNVTTAFLSETSNNVPASYGAVSVNNSNETTQSASAAASTTNDEAQATAAPEGETPDEESATTDEETRDGAIGTLTRRLRCLFSTITWPIVPLGTIVALALLWVLYAASSLDLRRTCSHPLHWYALASLILVAYIPHHAQVRSHLFHYSRERDGPIRPARVRMYDQFFHSVRLCSTFGYLGNPPATPLLSSLTFTF